MIQSPEAKYGHKSDIHIQLLLITSALIFMRETEHVEDHVNQMELIAKTC